MSGNFFEVLDSRRPGDPDSPCLYTDDAAVISYGELYALAARMAAQLRAMGATPGDRITAQVPKSPEALALYLACLRAGLVYMPLNSAYTRAELEYFLADARPAVVLCAPADETDMQAIVAAAAPSAAVSTLGVAGQGGFAAAARARSASAGIEPVAGSDQAAMIYTSGTTGRPKGVILTHGNLSANALTLVDAWGFSADDVLLHALPIFHVHGLFVATHCALLAGAAMHFLSRFDSAQVMTRLPASTVMMGVPTFYTRLLAEPAFDRERVAGMRLFISGSAPLLEETFNEFEARTGHRILERYGMSETGMNTSNPLDGPRLAGTVGQALPGIGVRVCDDADRVLPTGDVGGVQVKGPNVFAGYWGLAEKTAEEFTADGFFRTGDLGRLDEAGYLSIVGRAKDMVITGGYNVYPKEVELVLDECDGVLESAVFGLPHADYGEAVTAVVVAADAAAAPSAEALLASARERLAAYKVPKRVLVVQALPRNTMGKVQKAMLREQYADLYRH